MSAQSKGVIAVNEPLFSYIENWSAINYLIPIYSESGANQTLVGREGKDNPAFRDHRRLKTVLVHLAGIFSLDLRQLRKNCAQLVQRQNKVPLAFHPRLIMIPVHTRKPVTKDDGATGYVVLSKIDSIRGLTVKDSRFLFNDGSWLDVQQQVSSLFKIQGEALKIGQAAAQLYAESSAAAASLLNTKLDPKLNPVLNPVFNPDLKLEFNPEFNHGAEIPGFAEFYLQLNPTILLLQQVLNMLKLQLSVLSVLPAQLFQPASARSES